MNLDELGFFIFMQEQEEQAIENRCRNKNATSWESCPPYTPKDDENNFFPGICPPVGRDK